MDAFLYQGTLFLDGLWSGLLSSSSLTLIGMIGVTVGLVYMAAAIHEIRAVPRLVEMGVTSIAVGLAFAIARGISAEGGATGALVGLVFGLGLGLGLEFPITSDNLEHTWFGKLQTVYGTIMRIAVGLTGCLPLAITLLITLPVWLMLFLLLAIISLLGNTAFDLALSLGETLYKLVRIVERRFSTIASWLARRTVGTPDAEETNFSFMLRRVLPTSRILRWIFAIVMSLYFYTLSLVLGHLASIVSTPFLPSTLGASDTYVSAFAKAPVVAFLLGTLALIVGLLAWAATPHSKGDTAWQNFMKDMGWIADDIGEIADLNDPKAVTTAAEEIGHAIVNPNTRETKWTSDEERYTVRRELWRLGILVPFISFVIGLLNGQVLGRGFPGISHLQVDSPSHFATSLGHLAASAAPTILPQAVIFLGVYLLNRLAMKFSLPLLAALGLLLLLLGAALQAFQHLPVMDVLHNFPFR